RQALEQVAALPAFDDQRELRSGADALQLLRHEAPEGDLPLLRELTKVPGDVDAFFAADALDRTQVSVVGAVQGVERGAALAVRRRLGVVPVTVREHVEGAGQGRLPAARRARDHEDVVGAKLLHWGGGS